MFATLTPIIVDNSIGACCSNTANALLSLVGTAVSAHRYLERDAILKTTLRFPQNSNERHCNQISRQLHEVQQQIRSSAHCVPDHHISLLLLTFKHSLHRPRTRFVRKVRVCTSMHSPSGAFEMICSASGCT